VVEELAPLLVGLLQASPAELDQTVASCVAAAEKQLGIPAAFTEFQLIWLMKQGLVDRLP
jgi:hypothetical protein